MAVRGIIFDLGWTLVDFDGDALAIDQERARDLGSFLLHNGYQLDGTAVFARYAEETRALGEAGEPLNYEYPARLAMLRALRDFLSRDEAARLARAALAASFDCAVRRWQLYPDALSTLSALRDNGYRLGCVSNTHDGDHVWRIVDGCGLRSWLSPIYTSADVGLRKPHPDIFRQVLDDWRMSPDEVVMVGDTLNADVLGAHNVGMRGIWIDRGPVSPWSHNDVSQAYIVPDVTIRQLAELPELLNGAWSERG